MDCGEKTEELVVFGQGGADIDPDVPVNIVRLAACELTHAAPQSVCVNPGALKNMATMFVTLDTSHFDRSLLNNRV